EDEEHYGVRDVPPLLVRGEQRPDKENGGARGPDEGGEHRAGGEERRVRARRGFEVTGDEDAPRHDEEAAEQHDERHVVVAGMEERGGIVSRVENENGQAE